MSEDSIIAAIRQLSTLRVGDVVNELTFKEFHTLAFVISKKDNEGKNSNVKMMANEFDISSPAVSKTVSILERKGYLTRTTDKDNRRSVIIVPTKEGEEAFQRSKEKMDAFSKKVSDQLEKDEKETLIRLLNKYYTITKKELSIYKEKKEKEKQL